MAAGLDGSVERQFRARHVGHDHRIELFFHIGIGPDDIDADKLRIVAARIYNRDDLYGSLHRAENCDLGKI